MKIENTAKLILISLFGFIIIYFFYQGIISNPQIVGELDSLGYHIPIARSLLKGGLLSPPSLIKGLGYYPAIGGVILAAFLFLQIPLNLFNVLAIVILFLVLYLLGKSFGLKRDTSIIFAASFCLLNSVVRLLTNQRIDIWLAIFFSASLYFLNKPEKSNWYFAKLGTFLGLLIGVKYSGLFYAFILLIVYLKVLINNLNLKRFLYFVVPLTTLGLFWYIRNYILTGNPIYPGNFLFFKGHPDFDIQIWNPIISSFYWPRGLWLWIQAMVSEYLIWIMLMFIVPILAIKNQQSLKSPLKNLARIGVYNFVFYLVIPSWPINYYSDVRYLYTSFIVFFLFIFIYFKNSKNLINLYLLSVLSSASLFAQLYYRPKLILIWLLLISLFIFKMKPDIPKRFI